MSRSPGRGARQGPNGRRPPAVAPVEVTIESLGARGDGIAQHDGQKMFIPDALPGERVVARITGRRGDGLAGEVLSLLQAAPKREVPPCPHFGTCGGCALQHLGTAEYATWKRMLLVDALARVGVAEEAVAPLVLIPPGTRRRASFAIKLQKGKVTLGFNARASHELVDLSRCLLLAPPLERIMAPLRGMLPDVLSPGEEGEATITLPETGLDVLIVGEARLDLFTRERLRPSRKPRILPACRGGFPGRRSRNRSHCAASP